jgi:hypothetical protein
MDTTVLFSNELGIVNEENLASEKPENSPISPNGSDSGISMRSDDFKVRKTLIPLSKYF